MQQIFDNKLAELRLIPVVTINSPELARPLGQALSNAGLPIAEITMRTKCALDAIRELAWIGEFEVGAGTILNVQQAEAAVEAGAEFIVSPGLDQQLVQFCISENIPVYPGVSTATEVQRAFNWGLRSVKFFPAEACGGIKTLKALAAPFYEMKFIPTGGINRENVNDYLALPATLAVGGSWMVPTIEMERNEFANIEMKTREAVDLTRTT